MYEWTCVYKTIENGRAGWLSFRGGRLYKLDGVLFLFLDKCVYRDVCVFVCENV